MTGGPDPSRIGLTMCGVQRYACPCPLWTLSSSSPSSTIRIRPAGTLRYHELQGFFFTVASAPELVPPSEWLPIIFGEADAGYASLDQAHEILGQIIALYNTINAAVLDPPTLLPKDCPLRDAVLANFEGDAPMAQWSRGFLRGHQWLEALWKETVPQELDDELGSILMDVELLLLTRDRRGLPWRGRHGRSALRDDGGHDPPSLTHVGRSVRAHGSVNRHGACGA